MPYRIAASSAVGVIVLAVLGAVMGPQWDPVPLADPLEVQSADTAIGGAPEPGRYDVRTSVVTVQLDGAEVEAQISEPVGAHGDRPGIVFVHGAGTGRFSDAFVRQAHDLAASGVVTMVPNKRLDTYTTRHRDYPAMARDYEASVGLLIRLVWASRGRLPCCCATWVSSWASRRRPSCVWGWYLPAAKKISRPMV